MSEPIDEREFRRFDERNKALTARTPDDLRLITGISTERMFPEKGKILYIGDPWQILGQIMDREGVVTIDYQYGRPKSFTREVDRFKDIPLRNMEIAIERVELDSIWNQQYSEAERKWLSDLTPLLKEAYNQSLEPQKDDECIKAIEKWERLIDFLYADRDPEYRSLTPRFLPPNPNDEIESYELNNLKNFIWSKALLAKWGLEDLVDWRNIIQPKAVALEQELSSLQPWERKRRVEEAIQYWIEEIRLKKCTKKSEVVEGLFPRLPFRDKSFDRVVASYSFSFHSMHYLTVEQLKDLWQEIYRVLDSGGEAYIFPMNRMAETVERVNESLALMMEINPDFDYEFLDSPISEDMHFTLKIARAKPSETTLPQIH